MKKMKSFIFLTQLFTAFLYTNGFVITESTVNMKIKDDVDTKIANSLSEIRNSFTETAEKFLTMKVKHVEKILISMEAVNELSDNVALANNISSIRCGTGVGLCTTTVTNDVGRRMLQAGGFATVETTYDVTETQLSTIDGLSMTNETFESTLKSDIGVSSSLNITSLGSVVDIVVQMEGAVAEDPLGTDYIDDTNSLGLRATVLSQVNSQDDYVRSPVIDLCPTERTCTGRGTCDTVTGVCACNGDFWGIECETVCACVNEGECKNAYCHCDFPYYGLRCGGVSSLSSASV
jgi:hypothetical protein